MADETKSAQPASEASTKPVAEAGIETPRHPEESPLDPGPTCVHWGLLVLRVGIGLAFLAHGVPKLQGGAEGWAKIGGAMALVGLGFAPTFWGFMAALSEALGGLLLTLGLLVRPAALLLLVTMIVATVFLLNQPETGYSGWSHPLKMAVVFLGLLFTGGGRYALGAVIPGFKGRWFE
jgi:putative oxidoreductase